MHQPLALDPYPELHTAIRAALKLLREEIGMEMWVVTRKTTTQAVIVDAVQSGNLYPVSAGTTFDWKDTLCARMVAGEGPQFAPYLQVVPAYARAPVVSELPIGAYLGIPLADAHGKLLGTLCGVDPRPRQAELFQRSEPLLRVIGRFLASLLEREQGAAPHALRAVFCGSPLNSSARQMKARRSRARPLGRRREPRQGDPR
jgi:diguanylate cyclase